MSFAEKDFDSFYKELESDTEHLRKRHRSKGTIGGKEGERRRDDKEKKSFLAGKTKKKVMPYEKSRLKNRNEKSVSKEIDV